MWEAQHSRQATKHHQLEHAYCKYAVCMFHRHTVNHSWSCENSLPAVPSQPPLFPFWTAVPVASGALLHPVGHNALLLDL